MKQQSLLDDSGARVREDSIQEIVRRIRRVCDPSRVILFGSAAAGTMTPDSDIDLLVVEREVSDPRAESRRIRAALSGLASPFDVFVMSADRFEETRSVIGGIAWPADRHGREIFEVA